MSTCASVLKLVMQNDLVLSKGVEVKVDYVGKVGPGIDACRVILKIYSTIPKETSGLIKSYEVWSSQEYLEDNKYKYTDDGAKQFSLDILKKRFIESGSTVPRENGVKATSEHGIELGDPQYILSTFTRLNVIVTKNQVKWLKNQGTIKNSNVSAVVREIIENARKQ